MSRAPHKGKRKLATVLFAEIVDSAALVADADPEEANEKLLPWLRAMVETIDEHRGTVCQLLGNGIIAFFYASAAPEYHALMACLAARRLHRCCARSGGRGHQGLPSPVQFRVGISSGTIVAPRIPWGMLASLRIVGEPVHLASRAQESAEPGQALLTASTYALVAGRIAAKPGKTMQMGGTLGAVQTFVLEPGRREYRDPFSQ